MSTPIGQTLVADQHIQEFLRANPDVRQGIPKDPGFRPALFGEQAPPTEINTLAPFRGMGTAIAKTTPVAPTEHIDVILGSREWAIDAFRWPAEWGVRVAGEQPAPIGLHIDSPTFPIVVTPNAEKYSKSLGLYGALLRTTEIVHKVLPTSRALNVDMKTDPEEKGYTTICFSITTAESVESVLRLDDALKDELYDSIPADDRLYLSFIYNFG